MSLDLWLESNPCPTCGRGYDDASFNFTHNVSDMWRAAGVYGALYESEGETAGSIVDTLDKGIAAMYANPSTFTQFNAKNGWGTYEQALPWLISVAQACREHPEAIIKVWR